MPTDINPIPDTTAVILSYQGDTSDDAAAHTEGD